MVMLSKLNLNSLPKLPEDIIHLDISDNRILDLHVINTPKLEYIDASHNMICTIVDILPISLKFLDISSNKLKILDLGYCVNLQELAASHNLLTEVILPQGIKCVDINDNSLTYIDIPSSIEDITLYDNPELHKIIFYPESKLSYISLSNTNITSLNDFPDSIKEMDISRTPIDIITKLPRQLKIFSAVSSKLKQIDFEGCINLSSIEIAHGDSKILNAPRSIIISRQSCFIDGNDHQDYYNSDNDTQCEIPDVETIGFIEDNEANMNSEHNWGNINDFWDTNNHFDTNTSYHDSFEGFAHYNSITNQNESIPNDFWKPVAPPESLTKYFKYNLTI